MDFEVAPDAGQRHLPAARAGARRSAAAGRCARRRSTAARRSRRPTARPPRRRTDACSRSTPDHADAYLNLGALLCEARRCDEAVALYDEALERKPDEAAAALQPRASRSRTRGAGAKRSRATNACLQLDARPRRRALQRRPPARAARRREARGAPLQRLPPAGAPTLASMEPSPPSARIALVVMGVSGSGKSSVAAGIAHALGLHFIDGDGLHSAESVARMKSGTPLRDEDRWPWLERIGRTSRRRGAMAARCRHRLLGAAPRLPRPHPRRGAGRALRLPRRAGRGHPFAHGRPQRPLHAGKPARRASCRRSKSPEPDETDVLRLGIEQPVQAVIDAAVRALGPLRPTARSDPC